MTSIGAASGHTDSRRGAGRTIVRLRGALDVAEPAKASPSPRALAG
jgi:hypothetical protein